MVIMFGSKINIHNYVAAVLFPTILSGCTGYNSGHDKNIENNTKTIQVIRSTDAATQKSKKTDLAHAPSNYQPEPYSALPPRSRQDNSGPSHLAQCNRDLESLHRISPSGYARYRDEYDALMRSSASFMAVSGDISDEVSDLARPRFQFALVNLCYRIKNALAQTLISQAGGEGAR